MHAAEIKLMILVKNKGSAPSFMNGARVITSKKLVYPSTGGSFGFQVIPNPFARFLAYLYVIKESSKIIPRCETMDPR